MKYYTYQNEKQSFFTNIFEAVACYRNLKIEDEFDYCAIGIIADSWRGEVFYKEIENDVIVDLITTEIQAHIDEDFEYFGDDLKNEIKALIEVFNAEPF